MWAAARGAVSPDDLHVVHPCDVKRANRSLKSVSAETPPTPRALLQCPPFASVEITGRDRVDHLACSACRRFWKQASTVGGDALIACLSCVVLAAAVVATAARWVARSG